MSKKFTKKCLELNRTKLSFVKEYIESGEYVKAICIVAKFGKLDKSLEVVKMAHEVINNPSWIKLYFGNKTTEEVVIESVQAIKLFYKFN